jgi:Ca-activated chloride channel family protein
MHFGILTPAFGGRPWLLGVVAAALMVESPPAQEFSARTEMVEVYATVTDDKGRLVTDLAQADFQVFEDGRRQEVLTFTAGDVPVSLALAFDRSWSMQGKPLEGARMAARALLNELADGDRVTLIAISSEVDVVVPLTNDRLAIDQAVQALDPWGSTALHDAVVQALDAIEPAPGRRALVLVSDGLERNSQRTADDVYARVRASDVMIYPVALARRSPALFETLAASSGGRATATRAPDELPRIFRRFASELRHQYLLGYQPDIAGAPGYRRLDVHVTRPGLVVRARAGYTVAAR